MTRYRLSYLKTTILAAGVGLGLSVLTYVVVRGEPALPRLLTAAAGWAVALAAESVALGGVIALYRDRRDTGVKPDLFLAWNGARSEAAIRSGHADIGLGVRRLLRRVLRGRWILVGDLVEIRSATEISDTLDASDSVHALPFMAEMAKFCGQRAHVFRCVDKIYDYAGDKTLRRVNDVVLLAGLRCDGSDHGDCQASCYLLWKTVWLRRVTSSERAPLTDCSRPPRPEHRPLGAGAGAPRPRAGGYVCQYTELAAASAPMAAWDLRQDLRPLLSGNLTVAAFSVGLLTRLFNVAQAARRGVPYPALLRGHRDASPTAAQRVEPGAAVRVKAKEDVAATLDARGRNRGLWFDKEMTKHCGRQYQVLKRVERLIDGATGRMVEIKTPCVVLAGVDVSGEFLRFCAQHEYPFWRDVWLTRLRSTEPPEQREIERMTTQVLLEGDGDRRA